MSRYRVLRSDSDCEPGFNGLVLKNKSGIVNPQEMADLKQELLFELYKKILEDPSVKSRRLHTAEITEWHRRWLGNLYFWAGKERTVNLTKGGFAFASAHVLPELRESSQAQKLDRFTPCKPNCSPSSDLMAVQAVVGPLDDSSWDIELSCIIQQCAREFTRFVANSDPIQQALPCSV